MRAKIEWDKLRGLTNLNMISNPTVDLQIIFDRF